jgi:hypothetical protein
LLRARGENLRTLAVGAVSINGTTADDAGYYELDASMTLRRVNDPKAHEFLKRGVPIPRGVLTVDAASVLYIDDRGGRWRLPKGDASFDALTESGLYRIDREVCTERDLFNAHGTFYELPADNAGGFSKVRPVATHNRRIHDYCSYRGLLILTGITAGGAEEKNPHIIRSADGKAAVWAGTVDDLWKLGKPAGRGGPWKNSPAKAGVPSDPYLMNGFDAKRLTLSHDSNEEVTMRVEVDVTGDGLWVPHSSPKVPARGVSITTFHAAFQACWVRVTSDTDCSATAVLEYD